MPSIAPVAENDQHDPQDPWSLTGVTAPEFLQSTEAGSLAMGKVLMLLESI